MIERLLAVLSGQGAEQDAFRVSKEWVERDFEDLRRYRRAKFDAARMLRQLRRERKRLQGLKRARTVLRSVDRILKVHTEEKLTSREFRRAQRKIYRFAVMRDQGADASLIAGESGGEDNWAGKLLLRGRREQARFFESPDEFVRLAKIFNATEDGEPFLWLYAYIREFLDVCPKSYIEAGVFGKFMRSVFGVFFYAKSVRNRDFAKLAKLAGYFATSYLFDDILDDSGYTDSQKRAFSLNVNRILRSAKNTERELSGDPVMAFTESALARVRDILDEQRGVMVSQCYLAIADASAVGARWTYRTPLTDREIYSIAAVKAAYTRVIPAILAGRQLDQRFLSHCLRGGLIYQLTDDLRDIPDDLEKKSVTPFNYFLHGASKLELHPIEVFLVAVSRISGEFLPRIADAELLWIMRLTQALRLLRLKHGKSGLNDLFARLDFPSGELSGELAMIGECFDLIVDIEAEAARLYSDMAVRMRGGWTRKPVHGH